MKLEECVHTFWIRNKLPKHTYFSQKNQLYNPKECVVSNSFDKWGQGKESKDKFGRESQKIETNSDHTTLWNRYASELLYT